VCTWCCRFFFPCWLDKVNSSTGVREQVGDYDVIVDATDNPGTRYLINDACVLAGKPLVSGAAIGFHGQLSVYVGTLSLP